jgi:hypothetical protein
VNLSIGRGCKFLKDSTIMLKKLSIIISIVALFGCSQRKNNKTSIPENVTSLINYFDSNRLKEFDTVSFEKTVNWGNNSWIIADRKYVCYQYRIGFPNAVDSEYDFPASDSLERISIYNHQLFNTNFPLSITLPEENMEMILNKDGFVTCLLPYFDNGIPYTKIVFSSMSENVLFRSTNPFTYFKSRTKTMDSLGIEFISGHSTGNFITIDVKTEQGYLDYLPDDLYVRENYRHLFDSTIATGFRINKNWIWRKHEKT